MEHWNRAKNGLRTMFWAAVGSIVLDATRIAWTQEAMTITRHNIFSRALLLAVVIIAGHAYHTVLLRNLVSWRLGFALPWLFGFGILTAGMGLHGFHGSFVAFLLIGIGLVWLCSRSWRRSWRELAKIFQEPASNSSEQGRQ
ncbi:hypothetical protein [Prosthecobacter sp.]|uniref:hypothetical protein n=1 Tax=Prosthecobacter sp. TaxID=1965333 RepID=UPI00378415CB